MNFAGKQNIVVALTGIALCITVGVALSIAKGVSFFKLSSAHVKTTAAYSLALADIQRGDPVDARFVSMLIADVRRTSATCLATTKRMDRLVMQATNTLQILEVCRNDVKTADQILAELNAYETTGNKAALLPLLIEAERAFRDSSAAMDKPIDKTSGLILNVLIPLIIAISIVNIGLTIFFSHTTSHSIQRVISLLRRDTASDKIDDHVEHNIDSDLAELLRAANERAASDAINRKLSNELEYEVRKRTASLRLANQEMSEFAYRTSHDLKAPLSATKQLARFIKDDVQSGNLKEAHDNIDKIISKMERLERLIVDISSLTRAGIDSGNKESIDFKELYDEIIASVSERDRVEVADIFERIETSGPLMAERERVSIIIEHLLSNAIKYRDPDKNRSVIKLGANEESDRFVLTVEDNGMGIPSSRQSEVFERFKRFHPRIGTGSGLGLSIVKKHVDHLSGTIDFASSRRGTTFTIQLPK